MMIPALRRPCIVAVLVIGIQAVFAKPTFPGDLTFTPLGPEFRLNQYTNYGQDDGWAAMDDRARSVVTWTNLGDIYARLFAADGTARGDEFRVNEITPGTQNFARAAWQPNGNKFVVTWNDWNGNDSDLMGTFARVLDGNGNPLTPEFLVTEFVNGSQFDPDVAVGADGRFAIVWVDAGPRDGIAGIAMRIYESNNSPATGELRVNDPNSKSQVDPAVGIDQYGHITVTYTDASGRYGEPRDILMKSFDQSGTPLTPETRVNQVTIGLQRWSRIAMAADGSFAVVWQDEAGNDGDSRGLFARVFADVLHPLTGDLLVAANPVGDQVRPIVSCDQVGNFTVVWTDSSSGDEDVIVRRFDKMGVPLTPATVVSTVTAGPQFNPSIAVDDSGELVAAVFTHQSDVWGRWFQSPAIQPGGPVVPGAPLVLNFWLPGNENLAYFMFASFATSPGIDGQGRHLSLNFDALFTYSLMFPNGPDFFNFRGQLDAEGKGFSTVQIPSDPSLSGIDLYFATVGFDVNQPAGAAIRTITRPYQVHIP